MGIRITVPTQDLADGLADLDDVEAVVWDLTGEQPTGHLDVVVMPYTVRSGLLAGLDVSRIGLVQSQALGYDGVAESLPAGGVYANAVGVHETSTAELAMALMLASTRRVDDFVRSQSRGVWEQHWSPGLLDRRVLLVGVGGIGREILVRLSGFRADVVRVGTTARDDELGRVHGTDELTALLPTADVVVLAVPLNEETTGLVDDAFLAAMADDALLVNVSRGKVVDTDALLRTGGRIRFASDVFDPEPLPADHPLWTASGVLISPHVGGMTHSMADRFDRVLRRQLDLLRAGEAPENVVVRT